MEGAKPQPRGDRLLRIEEVMHRVGIRTTSVYKMIREGRFPKGIALGARCVVWPESSIDAWIAEQISRAADPPPHSAAQL